MMKHVLEYHRWILNESDDFKKYYLSTRPNYVYRRAGKDSAGKIIWQYQEKTTKDTKTWYPVKNADSIAALNKQYETNLKKQEAPAASATKSTLPSTVNPRDYWTLITIIACENYTSQPQGMADVAQSIYNRFNTKGQPYGKSIAEIILSANQYEPVKVGKGKGAKWDSIKSKESAIQVYLKTNGVTRPDAEAAINAAVGAQKNPTLIANAKVHVGSRTEFLSGKPSDPEAKGSIERSPADQHNTFFWNYAGRKNYYDAKLLAATPKPDTVKVGA